MISRAGKPAAVLAWLAIFILNAATQRAAAPDLVIINARIRTMVSPDSTAAALAITGSKIFAVGTSKRISALAGPKTMVIDARGRLVLPGFNDAHAHFMAIGNKFSSIDLGGARTPVEAKEKIRFYTRFLPKGRWILGGGWTPDRLPLKRELIDPVTPDHPLLVYRADGNSAFANGPALKLACISKSTLQPSGGEIEMDNSGEPTGVLHGSAINIVKMVRPPDHTRLWPAIAETATNYAAALGITSVTDTQSDDFAEVYRTLEGAGVLKTRIYDCVSLFDRAGSEKVIADDRDPEKMVRTGCVKGFSEGDMEEADNLLAKVKEADRQGYQVLLHAIGPAANAIVLDTVEKASAGLPRRDRRFRIEHAHNASGIEAARFRASGAVASVQPQLFYGGPTANETFRKLTTERMPLAFGADAPFAELDPLLGIRAAVLPMDGTTGMTVFEAMRAYTAGSAYAEFQENAKGTLENGKLADLVVLSEDIFRVPADRITSASVVMTIVGGRIVYQAADNLQK